MTTNLNRFQYKLFNLINSPQDVFRWSESGNSIIIDFSRLDSLLKKCNFWKSKNISSFVRQLNMYGFKIRVPFSENGKPMLPPNLKEYSNNYFKKNNFALLQKITRNGKPVPKKRKKISNNYFKKKNLGLPKITRNDKSTSRNLTKVTYPSQLSTSRIQKPTLEYMSYETESMQLNQTKVAYSRHHSKLSVQKPTLEYDDYETESMEPIKFSDVVPFANQITEEEQFETAFTPRHSAYCNALRDQVAKAFDSSINKALHEEVDEAVIPSPSPFASQQVIKQDKSFFSYLQSDLSHISESEQKRLQHIFMDSPQPLKLLNLLEPEEQNTSSSTLSEPIVLETVRDADFGVVLLSSPAGYQVQEYTI